MTRYRYDGTSPVTVPDLQRYDDDPLKPGEEFETDVVIHNALFHNMDADAPAVVPPLAPNQAAVIESLPRGEPLPDPIWPESIPAESPAPVEDKPPVSAPAPQPAAPAPEPAPPTEEATT